MGANLCMEPIHSPDGNGYVKIQNDLSRLIAETFGERRQDSPRENPAVIRR